MSKAYQQYATPPRVSVIIASLDGDRGGNVPKLLDDIDKQTFKEVEVIKIIGVSPQGKAINQGAKKAQGEILVVLDDDSRLASHDVIASLVDVLDSHKDVGMVGASIIQPAETNAFQRSLSRQLPRFSMDIVDEITDSDMPCHGCCAVPKRLFDEIGGESEDLVRGLDPDLRQRIRAKGYRVVLAPNTAARHPVPGNLRELMNFYFRNGKGSAIAQHLHPELVYDTEETMVWSGKRLQRPFLQRLLNYPFRFCKSLSKFHLLRATGEIVYAFGFVWGTITQRRLKT